MKFQFPLTSFLLASAYVACVIFTLRGDGALAATQPQHATATASREQQAARVKRFLQRTVEDLNLSRQLAEEDIAELEKRLDDIPPGKSMQMEADLLSLLDTQYSYLDWVKDRIEEFEGDMEQLSAENLTGSDFLENSLVEMVSMLKELEKVLQDKVDRFSAEEKKTCDSFPSEKLLPPQKDGSGKRERSMGDGTGEKASTGKDTEQSENEKTVARDDVKSPPHADDGLCSHYRILAERGNGEAEWIRLQMDEYTMLARVARILPRDTSRFRQEIDDVIHMTIKAYKDEISLLDSKIDRLEKYRANITPTDDSQETEQSSELADLFVKLQIRYNDLINRLKTRIGAWEAEAAQIGPPVR